MSQPSTFCHCLLIKITMNENEEIFTHLYYERRSIISTLLGLKWKKKMFSINEMNMLYEKAKMLIHNFPMQQINFIYRDKSFEYFDKIDAIGRQNGTDEKVMPRSTFFILRSLFGPKRISITSTYLMDPNRYSLFFADFYCARNTSDYHMITLALCEVGTQEEGFCRENLVQLDMWDNPILKLVDISSNGSGRQCWITTDTGIQIYLYLCADFNISKCLKNEECHCSNVHHLEFGVNDHKLAIGQTSDEECDICAIRDLNSSAEGSGSSQLLAPTMAKFNSLSIAQSPNNANGTATGGSWRIWKFECNYLPGICPVCKARNTTILLGNAEGELICELCHKFCNMKNKDPQKMAVISTERWPNYIQKTESVFHIDGMILSGKILWPSQMGKAINCSKQVGIGIFREGIIPDFDQRQQSLNNGGYFSLLFFVKMRDYHAKIDQMDQIFNSFLQFIYADGGLAKRYGSVLCAIFVRADIDLMNPSIQYCYNSSTNLPAKFRFEVWISDRSVKSVLWSDLDKWIARVREDFGFGNDTKFSFKNSFHSERSISIAKYSLCLCIPALFAILRIFLLFTNINISRQDFVMNSDHSQVYLFCFNINKTENFTTWSSLFTTGTFSSTFIIIILINFLIWHKIRQTVVPGQEQSVATSRQVGRALLIQALLPLILQTIPTALLSFSVVIGHDISSLTSFLYTQTWTSCIYPLATMAIIGHYRSEIKKMLACKNVSVSVVYPSTQ